MNTFTIGKAIPESTKRTSKRMRDGDENTSVKSVNAVVHARSSALSITGAERSARFRRHSARKSALCAASFAAQSTISSLSVLRS